MSGQPIDMRPDHEVMIRDILLARLPKGVRVWAFGSRAKWLAKPYSDLDLALEAADCLPDALIADLKDDFQESDLPWKVDVLDLNAIAPSFRKLIDKDKVGFSLGLEMVSAHTACGGGSNGADCNAGMNKVELSKVVTISTHKITPDQCASDGYVSTNSMIGEAGGVEFGSSIIPQGKSTAYSYDDVLFSNIRTYFKKVWLSDREGGCSNDVLVFRATQGSIDAHFLFYCLTHPEFTEYSVRTSKGTKMPRGDKAALLRYEVDLPSLPQQRAIAAILGSLDDKIELNRHMNATLEAMARAIFKDWFVDFGPTRARMEGRKPYLAPEIWQLFPDKLGGDGLPVGWEEKPLDEIAAFLNGLALQKFPASDDDNYLPVIKISELRNGISAKTNKASREVPKKYVVKDGDFIFSWSGSLMAKFWTCGEGALNQHLFKVTSKDYPAWLYSQWVFHHLAEFQGIAKSKATTMGHIQRGHLKAARTICPPADVLERLGAVIGPLVTKAIKTELESRTLAQTRDLLLPKLMSGEIRVREAKKRWRDYSS